jgi:acyl carrier protein
MSREAVFKTVVEVVARYIRDKSLLDAVTGKTRIVEDLDVNSARLVDVVIALEDEYDIEVDDDTVNAIRTLDDTVDTILGELERK